MKLILTGSLAIASLFSPTRGEDAPASEATAAREEAENYFEDDKPRQAVASLAEAARRHPADRVLGSMFYSALRNHVWYAPQTLPFKVDGAVEALAFSDDGKKLASGTVTGEVLVFSTESLDAGKAEAAKITLPKEDGAILTLAFTKDGSKLAVVSKTSGLRLWDLESKKAVFESAKPARAVTASAKAAAADVIAFGTAGGAIQAVDLRTGKVIADLSQPGGAVQALAVSRNAAKLAAASHDQTVRTWNLETAAPIGPGLAHQGAVLALDFSVDERYVATGGEEKIARLWDPEDAVIVMPAMNCDGKISKIRVSGDGSRIATLLGDGTMEFWDALTARNLPFGVREDAPMTDFLWTRGGLRAFSASKGGHLSVWTMLQGKRRGETIPFSGPVQAIAINPDAKLLAGGTENGEVRIWRTDEGAPLTTVRRHFARARTAFYSADGNHLITTAEDGTAHHWISGQVQPLGPALKHSGKVTCGVFNHDASKILTSDDTGLAHLWDAATGKPDGAPFRHSAPVNWVDFAPSGDRFVTASGPNATIWSITQRKKPLAVIKHPAGRSKSELKCVRFSPDGRWLVTASTDGTARVWEVATHKAVTVIDRHAPVWCARFSPDGTRLVVTGEDAQAIVYDTATWKPVGTPILASGTVFSAALTEDNRFLVIASLLLDAVQFYEVATGRPLGEGLDIHTQATNVDYLLQDKVVVAACDDGSVRAVESPFVAQDVPPWMCDFAERLIGLRKTGPDQFARVETEVAQLNADVAAVGESNEDFPRLAHWLMATGKQRHGMPRFTSTLAANIAQRVNEHSTEALFECYDAVSSDPLVTGALSLYIPNARQGEVLADIVLKQPNDPLARCYAAGTLINAGRRYEAQAILNKAVADAPDDPLVLRRAAKLRARVLDTTGALELFEKTIRLIPNDYESHRAYGWALYHLHRPAAAAAQFHRAEEIVGDMSDDVIAGICLSEAAQKHQPQATAAYRRLIALDPVWKDSGHLLSLRGWVQDELDELEKVRQATVAKK
ncbi:MAG TPA: PQQ-binding-like beta-propeller repeat protein [Chthoniobacter sp.]